MTDYIVSGTDLTAVANKIRSKGGTSAQLEFPTEFISAIEAITGGGSGGDDPFALTDYIESSGTQWIDTGYLVSDTSRFELVANVNSTNAQYASMFGTRTGSAQTSSVLGAFFWAKLNGVSTFTADWGAGQTQLNNLPPSSSIYGVKAIYGLSKYNAIINNQALGSFGKYINSVVVPTNQYPLYLFNLDEAGHEYGAATRCSMKLYRFRVYEDDALVMELLPYEDNGEACLKDSITGTLYKNAGTGAFTFGVDS